MLPNKFKKIGFFIFLATFFIAFAQINSLSNSEIIRNTLEVLGFIGLSIIAFAKEKVDDEFLNHIRIRIIIIVILLTFCYSLLDIFLFKVRHLYILELLQIQLLLYVVLFHLFKRKWSIK